MITRRHFTAVLAGMAAAPAIPTLSFAQAAAPALRATDLPVPDFAQLRRQAEFIAGVRPHRKGGVRLSLQQLDTPQGRKFLIHNYGHSGAGITLSFGCASVVCDYVETVQNLMRGTSLRPTVAVLGSGVIGLTTATELRRKFRQLPITVYSKELNPAKTTSFKAGGQFEPSQLHDEYKGSNRELLNYYLRLSARRIREISSSSRAAQYGIAARKNYTFDDRQDGFDEFTPLDVVPAYRRGRLPFKGLQDIGREYSTWLINPTILLPKLAADLQPSGIATRVKDFQSRAEVEQLQETIIVNCTGFGAKALFNDDMMEARRGLLVKLRNDNGRFDYFFSGGCRNDRISYMFGRQKDIVVGGTVKRDDLSETISDQDKVACNRLIDNIEKVFRGESNSCADPLTS